MASAQEDVDAQQERDEEQPDSVKENKSRMDSLLQIGKVLFHKENYKETVQYLLRAQSIAHELQDDSSEISCCTMLGYAYFWLREYNNAIEYNQKGLEISTKIGDRSGEASSNGIFGIIYHGLAQYEKAILYSQESLKISTEIGNPSGVANNNKNLGNSYVSLGKYQKAIECYEKSKKFFTEIGDQSGIADNKTNLANVYLAFGEYKKAIDYCQEGLVVSTNNRNQSGIEVNNAMLGNGYFLLGKYEQAIHYYQKALEVSTDIGDELKIAKNIGNLGNAYYSLGEYQKAIDYYKDSIEISTKIGEESATADTKGNLGNVYGSLGEYEKAIDCYQNSLKMNTKIGNLPGKAGNLGSLGNAYSCLGKPEEAILYHKEGLELCDKIGNPLRVVASINANLGKDYLSLGKLEAAIDCYKKSLEISINIEDKLGIARTQRNLGDAYRSLGQYESAIDYYLKGLPISTEIGDNLLIANINESLGVSYYLQVEPTGVHNEEAVSMFQVAADYLEESIKYSDKTFSGLSVDENKISFTKQYFQRHVKLMCCFISLKRIEAALLVIDLGKAKGLHTFMEKQNKSESDIISDYACKTWKSIHKNEEKMETKEIEDILELKPSNSTVLLFSFCMSKYLFIWVVNGEGDIKHYIWEESKDTSFSEENIYDNLKKLLKTFSVHLKRDSSFNKLDSDSTSSEQMIMPTQSTMRKIAHDETDRKCQAALWPKHQSGYDTPETPEDILRNLFRVLIEPVKDWIKGTKLIIVPDKFLFFLPFCALRDENECPLTENYSIQITPSLHTLVSSIKRSRDSSLGFALFVGNPTVGEVSFCGKNIKPDVLPRATQEVQCLSKLFAAKALVKGEATKERVLKFINGAGIIHIAAHGERERGEIFLSPGHNATAQSSKENRPKENLYLLKQQDIMDIGINARLVVLSCCHTGKGEISCEGVVGLTRAFLAAGARCVLATLWRLDDEATKLFMECFYKEICNETSVCDALKRSQQTFQTLPRFKHFGFWAPFTIYGEDVKFSKDDLEEIRQKSREMSVKV